MKPKAEAPPPASTGGSGSTNTKECKICCACPETRAARDECVIRRGMEDPVCRDLIEKHFACLLTEGFTKEQVDKLRRSSS